MSDRVPHRFDDESRRGAVGVADAEVDYVRARRGLGAALAVNLGKDERRQGVDAFGADSHEQEGINEIAGEARLRAASLDRILGSSSG